ncbi:queuosine precursor transporter [Erythrobacter sp. EC-HK427]|uniref:queuosine precursor transporter n=1 Tax=Erythrobacter sp. EC-HK427 TaxID=2038396 RepID=UPI00125627B6|nr:queuosine precursor transporter [Erythrobacter sp. EC-HK427]VVT11025.1 putative queuosine precursor transporter [Erythrobacter sp. EC-HK427]
MTDTAPPAPAAPITRSMFVLTLLYGGMTVIAGVLAFKQFAIGPLKVEAGILAFLMLVVISSAIAQIHGKAAADRLVLWGFLPLAFSIVLIGIVLALPASPDMPAENLAAFERVHGQTPRIMAAGPVAYGVSLLLNVWIFNKLRGTGDGGGIWLMARGAIASAISQAIDTVIFITLAFYGEFPIGELLVGQAIAKIALSFVLVPFLIAGAVALAKRLDQR